MRKLTTLFLSLFLLVAMASSAQTTSYSLFNECTFSVKLPTTFKSKLIESSPDFCQYQTSSGNVMLITFNSTNISRFEIVEVVELFQNAINLSTLKITFKKQEGNWFIIYGTDEVTGEMVYWKRVVGENFISDLRAEYKESQKDLIEPYLEEMVESFVSE